MIAPALLCFILVPLCHSTTGFSTVPETAGPPGTPHHCQKLSFEKLSCCNMDLSSFPSGLDPRLTRLDMSNNIIRDLKVVNLRSLQELDVSHNRLQFIHEGAFQNLVQLHTLNLAVNMLNNNALNNSKAFHEFHTLLSLDMSFNGLDHDAVEVYLRNMSSLQHLTLSGNSLTKLSPRLFTGSWNLRSINMENNLILDIEGGTFEPLKRLTMLNLARNNLVCICDFKLHGLKFLNLSRNSIEFFITHQNDNVYQLETLDLSYNSLLYFPIVPKINNLKYLQLQNNKVGVFGRELSILEASSLYMEITNSEPYRTEGENDIYFSWEQMPLAGLDLSNNQFTYFPLKPLHRLRSLESLNMNDNCLLDLNFDVTKNNSRVGLPHPQYLPSLRYLDLQRNQIQHLSPNFFDALPKIETLNLRSNMVNPCAPGNMSDPMRQDTDNTPCGSFEGIRTLKHLDLRENGIKTLFPYTFQHTPLVSLDLSDNKDMTMARQALAGLENTLESLSISGNEMRGSDLSLQCLGVLKKLNLANNHMNILPNTIGCSPLKELDLRNNSFTSLNEQIIGDLSLQLNFMLIRGNTFNCCTTAWLKILSKAKVKILDLEKATCLYSFNMSTSIESLSSHAKRCPLEPNSEADGPNLVIPTVVFVVAILFLIIILILVKKVVYTKGHSLTLKSNKVASFQYHNDDQLSTGVAKINIFEAGLT